MSKFLANENISRASVELLRENGLDVSWVSDSIPSVNDEAVLDAARKENRIVITYDSDYGEMIYGRKLARPLGVIYLRLRSNDEAEPAEILLKYLKTDAGFFENRFSVVTENGIRYKTL